MAPETRRPVALSAALVCTALLGCAARTSTTTGPLAGKDRATSLAFCVTEGAGHNCVVRDSKAAAHVLATGGPSPRLVVAFPAGNSGAALWARPHKAKTSSLLIEGPPRTFQRGRQRGVRFKLYSTTSLEITGMVTGSVRTIRDYNHHRNLAHYQGIVVRAAAGITALEVKHRQELAALGLSARELLERSVVRVRLVSERPAHVEAVKTSLSGKEQVLLSVRCGQGRVERRGQRLIITGPAPLLLDVEAATTHPHLEGLPQHQLLRPAARRLLTGEQHRAALRSLSFLATRRKFMAGSWRFLTYFGRDTLMSLWLLRPVLSPAALEAGLQSVLDNLSPEGMVAHEESLGDQAALERLERFTKLAGADRLAEGLAELRRLDQPTFAYTMVDDDLMLLLVADAYLRDPAVSKHRAAAFWAHKTRSGATNLEALARNLDFVMGRAAPYAASGKATDLVSLRPGADAGDWRDSGDGLGGGRFPASVNAYLMPAALEAALRLMKSSTPGQARLLATGRRLELKHLAAPDLRGRLESMARRWATAHEHFTVRLGPEQIRKRLDVFWASLHETERGLLRPTADDIMGTPNPVSARGLTFDALALDAKGTPVVEVMHTDDGFALLALDLPLERISRLLEKYELTYPLGLRHPFGVYVANPALSSRTPDLKTFDRGHYHGTVVWAWQQGLLQLGLMRQLRRCREADTAEASILAVRIKAALGQIAKSEERVGRLRGSELWGVRVVGERLQAGPYRPGAGHATESNALQLWSNISLAVDLERGQLAK